MKWCRQNKLLSNGKCLPDMQECVKERCNQWQPFTQYDRINCMSVDELTLFLFEWGDHNITICNTLCGYGSMCEYCEDNTYGRPCVRALNEMLREKHIKIDYSKREFEDIWNGEFK